MTSRTFARKQKIAAWEAVAEEIYEKRSSTDHKERTSRLQEIFEDNEILISPLLERCPRCTTILSFILEKKFSRVRKVDKNLKMTDWGDEECQRVGRSLSTFIRKRKTGAVAIDAWRLNYIQLDVLFKEVAGFEEFMVVIANNLMRNSIYGTVYRVTVGAALSMTDAVTDIYVISTYYQSEELYGQANALLAMLLGNLFVQLVVVYLQYNKKSWLTIGKEALITMTFMRPAVDTYRVSMHQEDEEVTLDKLDLLIANKVIELGCESIPGCVLQLYVWLKNPEKAGTYALVSIAISCLTTGFASAMIAFDLDVDAPYRKMQPNFYGYIPNDHDLRGRIFVLMTLVSALHNLSRSLGCALLAVSNTDNLVLIFIGGEMGLYLLYKCFCGDFICHLPLSGFLAIWVSFFHRVVEKVVTDFSGCLHCRHPYELGGLGFTISVIWAQAFPLAALQFFEDGAMKKDITAVFVVSFSLWLVLNIIFFCTIDSHYLNTFFGSKTGAEFLREFFLTSEEDEYRFNAIFKKRIQYTKSIHGEVKEWVRSNIDEWKREKPNWFRIELIPDEFLPKEAFEAEGGARRHRSTLFREFVRLREASAGSVHPQKAEEMKLEDL